MCEYAMFFKVKFSLDLDLMIQHGHNHVLYMIHSKIQTVKSHELNSNISLILTTLDSCLNTHLAHVLYLNNMRVNC
jgi:hypothetical protein